MSSFLIGAILDEVVKAINEGGDPDISAFMHRSGEIVIECEGCKKQIVLQEKRQ